VNLVCCVCGKPEVAVITFDESEPAYLLVCAKHGGRFEEFEARSWLKRKAELTRKRK
jgi:transcription elongation factor Elf1